MRTCLFLWFLSVSAFGFSQDKEIYALLNNGSAKSIDAKIMTLNIKEKSLAKAYKGALLAKRASYYSSPKDRLKFFKEGVVLIEKAVETEPNSIEIRFLRYVIQTKSPGFLNYKDEIATDKALIEKNSQKLTASLTAIIEDFNIANNNSRIELK